MTLTTAAELEVFGAWNEAFCERVFLCHSLPDYDICIQRVKQILHSGDDADALLFERGGRERWILNVKRNGGKMVPELHEEWHDYSLYLTGGNDMQIGERIENGENRGNGEVRNGTLVHPTLHTIRAGDHMWVPAGKAHMNDALPGTAFLIVKIRTGTERESTLLEDASFSFSDVFHKRGGIQ